MAHVDRLSEKVLEMLTGQLGESLGQLLESSIRDVNKADLAESFSVWMVGLDKLVEDSTDLRELATQTGRWHHQIRVDEQAEAFARSRPLGADPLSWRITEVFQSELAKRIDTSITWVDMNLEGDPLVRLLVVPAYHLTAFWLVDDADSQVIIIDAPLHYDTLQADHQVLTQKEFLDKLRQLPHIEGRTK